MVPLLPVTATALPDGSEAVGNSSTGFGEHIKLETAKWRKLIKDLGLKSE